MTDSYPKTVEEALADYLKRGYVEVEEHKGIKPGARVRNSGEQYPKAYRDGTAVVRHVLLKDPSSWSNTWGRPDVEVIVERDKPRIGTSTLGMWSDYGTCLVEERGSI